MTASIYSILLLLAKLDARSQATLLAQIDRFYFASPVQRHALIADWQQRTRDTTPSALT